MNKELHRNEASTSLPPREWNVGLNGEERSRRQHPLEEYHAAREPTRDAREHLHRGLVADELAKPVTVQQFEKVPTESEPEREKSHRYDDSELSSAHAHASTHQESEQSCAT